MVLIQGYSEHTGERERWFPSPCGDYGSYRGKDFNNKSKERLVSVPLRGLWFLSTAWLMRIVKIATYSFRPLAGIMVLILYLLKWEAWFYEKVSVPLRGLWFLSRVYKLTTGETLSFRPLAGIMVLISVVPVLNRWSASCFRPLAGIMVLIFQRKRWVCRTVRGRFRPLAGIMVLIVHEMCHLWQEYDGVSVPLRGLWFLSDRPIMVIWLCQFPSPCGDYGSYQGWQPAYWWDKPYVSVPLRGLWFLSEKIWNLSFDSDENVSVPLRGLWFLSLMKNLRHVKFARGVSVPLRGLWFLSPWQLNTNREKPLLFPSPCGDYGSYQGRK